MLRRRNSDTNFSDSETSNISSDSKQWANNARDGSCSFSNRRDQSGLKCCCAAMWNARKKNTILLLFLDSKFAKTKTNARRFRCRQNKPEVRRIRQEEYYFISKLDLKFKVKSSKVLHLEHSLYGGETWTLRKVDQKYLESFKAWC